MICNIVDRPTLKKGAVRVVEFNHSRTAGLLSTSVSASTWAVKNSSIASLASDALASDVATVTITASAAGETLITNTITFADGQKDLFGLKLKVIDLDYI